ncbi:MAG: extracellular solute-binding protein [Lachnospiraceae bacterium]|nr:extracellular solute-binding protein [Lachnospiraceae bacterium]
MKKFTKSVLAVLMMACMLFGLTACGGENTNTPDPTPTQAADTGNTDPTKAPDPTPTEVPEDRGEVITIRYGTHWVNGLDPHFTDEVTGEYVMAADQREARYAAEAAILEAYNVKFEYIGFGDTVQVLLQSVMANDPVCDLAVVWGGAEDDILGQNVLQKLDDYAYIFEDEEYSWMFLDKLYGNHYYLTDVVRFIPRWPLVYNVDLIEDAGLENPSVTFQNGNWTWSTFKKLLTELDAYYANEPNISAYLTDPRFAELSAMYSAGGAIYGVDGLSVNSPASKKAMAYMKELLEAGLMTGDGVEIGVDHDPNWTTNCEFFRTGKTVFTDHADWLIGWSGGTLAESSGVTGVPQSMGIVPWPRPDDMAFDSEEYRQVMTLGDSVAVLKGVDKERTELALKAYALYTKTYYTTLAGVDTMAEYKESRMAQEAFTTFGLDIEHEEYGEAILDCFR